jgi:hypothetical protein
MYTKASNDPNDDSSMGTETESQASAGNDQSLVRMLENGDSNDGGDEFHPNGLQAVDDEKTIEAEEKLDQDMTYDVSG